MNILETELVNLQSETNTIKTPQQIASTGVVGFTSRIGKKFILKRQSTYDVPTAEFYVLYNSDSDFPLVNFTYKITENGVLRPTPRSSALVSASGASDALYSQQFAAYRYSLVGTVTNKPRWDLSSPNVEGRVLTIVLPASISASFITIGVEVTCQSSAQGSLAFDLEAGSVEWQ